ncbi:MAG TPA: RNA polymerase-binding protein DksA [Burkholderiales bacterium]|nr:RNA polymerase-binding protein DksA [Burkholderiales bacterium]
MTKKSPKPMSEAELLASDPKDYMNEAQLAFFRQRLLDMKAELVNNAANTAEHLREMTIPSDPADRATLEEEYALELRTRERERKLLSKVEGALRRIDDESYGYCEETGEPIGLPRLLARPTATLTIDAQERRERSQKAFAD